MFLLLPSWLGRFSSTCHLLWELVSQTPSTWIGFCVCRISSRRCSFKTRYPGPFHVRSPNPTSCISGLCAHNRVPERCIPWLWFRDTHGALERKRVRHERGCVCPRLSCGAVIRKRTLLRCEEANTAHDHVRWDSQDCFNPLLKSEKFIKVY
jgi:hypothetical protein